MNRFFKNLFGTKTKPTTTRKTGFRPTCEMLEDRRLAAGDIQFANGLLTINGGAYMDVAKIELTGNLIVAKLWSAQNANVVLDANSPPPESDSTNVNFEIRSELASAVSKVKFHGYDGNDHYRNLTSEQSMAFGGSGNDTLQGGRYFDELVGDVGDDTYVFVGDRIGTVLVNEPPYVIVGGNNLGGIDTLDFTGMSRAIKIDLAITADWQTVAAEIPEGTYDTSMGIWLSGSQTVLTGSGTQTAYYSSVIENVKGTNFDDTIRGNSSANQLEGRGGSDRLEGRQGNDSLLGGSASDTLDGGAGDDSLAGSSGGDIYVFGSDATGLDTITETTGIDTLDFTNFTAGVTIDLTESSQAAAGSLQLTLVTPAELENLKGTAQGDTLRGNDKANRLEGLGGADSLLGRDGNDTLEGSSGKDTLEGGAGDDTLTGGSNSDTYRFSGLELGSDQVNEAANVDRDTLDFAQLGGGLINMAGDTRYFSLTATTAQDISNFTYRAVILTLSSGSGIEDVIGSAHRDLIRGNFRDNNIQGGGGNDDLQGADGNDTLSGGEGHDLIEGDGGNDTLNGDSGNDTLFGGVGDDLVFGDSGNDELNGHSKGTWYGGDDDGDDTLLGGLDNDKHWDGFSYWES